MHDISHSMCEFQIVWNVDVCVLPLHMHFRWGVTQCRKIPLLSIAHPVEGKIISGIEGVLGDGTHPMP